ncbi:tctex1 domain-containing 4 isoform X4 [Brachionus plicatilis]|uniref:Tctex1 domain-containing 4 isoform X4 n=1 Tax=Brachionus plicatilis TaxID=10195 RepID=A0A3M7QGT6_BRAPC|nr:tctex1 domain-containing 4 isoform X4 [Brachionus plicatilis]
METETKNEIEHSADVKKISKKKLQDYNSKFSGSRKSSLATAETNFFKSNIPRVENTFKLSPDDSKRFYAYKLKPIIQETIVSEVDKADAQSTNCQHLTMELADIIRSLTKDVYQPRYKVLVFVAVGDNKGQDLRLASRCLWNTEFDNCVSVSHTTKNLWASAIVYILYTD